MFMYTITNYSIYFIKYFNNKVSFIEKWEKVFG